MLNSDAVQVRASASGAGSHAASSSGRSQGPHPPNPVECRHVFFFFFFSLTGQVKRAPKALAALCTYAMQRSRALNLKLSITKSEVASFFAQFSIGNSLIRAGSCRVVHCCKRRCSQSDTNASAIGEIYDFVSLIECEWLVTMTPVSRSSQGHSAALRGAAAQLQGHGHRCVVMRAQRTCQ